MSGPNYVVSNLDLFHTSGRYAVGATNLRIETR